MSIQLNASYYNAGKLHLSASGGDYDYSNIIIKIDTGWVSNEFHVEFVNTECLEPCFEAQYDSDRPASGGFTFPFEENGTYQVAFQVDGITKSGTIIISDYRYQFDISLPPKLTFSGERNYATRIPKKGLFCSLLNTEHQQEARNALINSLSEYGDFTTTNIPSGIYGAYEVLDTGEVTNNSTTEDTCFFVLYNGDPETLEYAIEQWEYQYPGFSEFTCWLHDGNGNSVIMP